MYAYNGIHLHTWYTILIVCIYIYAVYCIYRERREERGERESDEWRVSVSLCDDALAFVLCKKIGDTRDTCM
jgi:hypothetical protein